MADAPLDRDYDVGARPPDVPCDFCGDIIAWPELASATFLPRTAETPWAADGPPRVPDFRDHFTCSIARRDGKTPPARAVAAPAPFCTTPHHSAPPGATP